MDEKVEILHIEDDVNDAELVKGVLEEEGLSINITRVCTEGEFLENINTKTFDLIISDYSMPGFNGKVALDISKHRVPNTPFIFVSGTIGEDAAIESMVNGATDYVLKTKLSRLLPAVKRALKDARNRKLLLITEKELRESEDRFRRLAENAPDIIFRYRLGANKGFEYVSPACISLTGYTPREHYADPDLHFKIIHPDDIHLVSGSPENAIFRQSVELRWIRKDGEIVWTEHRIAPIYDSGTLIGVEGIVRDITDRKLSEARLRTSEARYQTLFESMDEGFCVIEMIYDKNNIAIDYRFIEINPAFIKQTGLQNALGKTIREMVPAHDKHWFEIYDKVAKTGEPIRFERSAVAMGRDYDVFAFCIGNSGIRKVGILFKDITERNKILESLKESEERFRVLVEGIKDYAIFKLSPQGIVETWNPGIEQIKGYKKEDVLGKHFSMFFLEKDREQGIPDMVLKTAIAKGKFEADGKRVRRNGTEFWAHIIVTPIYNTENTLLGFVKIIQDITTRLKLEEEKQYLEEKMRQSQKMEAIGTLAGGIAHDFNNILGIMLAHVTFLPQFVNDREKHAKSIDVISKSIQRGANLVKQMLTFARKTEITFEVVRMKDMIEEIIPLVKETFPKIITLDVSIEENIPLIKADKTQIHQILLNLCVNARDAMMPNGGGLTITIRQMNGNEVRRLSENAKNESYIELSVIDTGMGMDKQTQARILEPFFTTKEPGKGTGLGLSTVYGIVERHNGFIVIESDIGKGTAFRIFLPVENDEKKTAPIKSSLKNDPPGGTETILLVEDEKLLQDMIKTVLEVKGYTVLSAFTGKRGIELFKANSANIDLIITDLDLPEMSGDAMFEEIKKINPHARIIVASGYFEPNKQSQLFSNGVKEIIQKPFAAEEILIKIRNVLK